MTSEIGPVFSPSWRLYRAMAVRRLCCAHLNWSQTEQRERVDELFPVEPVDWPSLELAPERRWPVTPDARPLPRMAVALRELRQWADIPDAPIHHAAIVLAAHELLAQWLRHDPPAPAHRTPAPPAQMPEIP